MNCAGSIQFNDTSVLCLSSLYCDSKELKLSLESIKSFTIGSNSSRMCSNFARHSSKVSLPRCAASLMGLGLLFFSNTFILSAMAALPFSQALYLFTKAMYSLSTVPVSFTCFSPSASGIIHLSTISFIDSSRFSR
jgi:hypothetical protein